MAMRRQITKPAARFRRRRARLDWYWQIYEPIVPALRGWPVAPPRVRR